MKLLRHELLKLLLLLNNGTVLLPSHISVDEVFRSFINLWVVSLAHRPEHFLFANKLDCNDHSLVKSIEELHLSLS